MIDVMTLEYMIFYSLPDLSLDLHFDNIGYADVLESTSKIDFFSRFLLSLMKICGPSFLLINLSAPQRKCTESSLLEYHARHLQY